MRVIANLTSTWLAQQGCHGFRPPERMLDDCKLAFIEKRANFVSSKCKESKRGRAARFNALAAEAKRITLRFGPCCPELAGENVPKLVLAVVEEAPLESHDRGKAKGKQRTLHGSRRPLAVFDARRRLLHFFRVARGALGNPLLTQRSSTCPQTKSRASCLVAAGRASGS
jgi:hypothetical protein